MTVRKYLTWMAVLALPLCAGAAATTAISDPFDDQANGARPSGSIPSNWSEPTTSIVEVTIPPAAPGSHAERPLSANPLWAMPVKQFSVTRARPIFLPSRRPPAPPLSTVAVAKVIAAPKPKESEQPKLSLVGTIAGDDDKLAILVDETTRRVLRLRVGEEFNGWKLQSVRGREVAFQKDQLNFVVALPQPGLSQPSVAVREVPAVVPDTSLLPVNVRRPGRQ